MAVATFCLQTYFICFAKCFGFFLFLNWISIYINKLGDYTQKSFFLASFEKSENGKAQYLLLCSHNFQ